MNLLQRATRSAGHVTLLSLVGFLIGGCGVDLCYLVPAAIGQIDLVLNSVPVAQAINDDRLSEDVRAKLMLIRDAREYARDVIGLPVARIALERL